ncbi:hypothetical protein TNCV_2310981 [Trichonephila clavipes]|nr:hypothetical protein TNCV_2310981 [Trichonephila clavipes]
MLNVRHRAARLAWAKEHRLECKRVAWSNQRERVSIADERLRIWHQAHKVMDLACHVQGMMAQSWSVVF